MKFSTFTKALLALLLFATPAHAQGVFPYQLEATDTPADTEVPSYDSATGKFTWAAGGGTTELVFKTMDTPSGTDPVADSTTDTLTWTAGGGCTVTGDSSTDTIDITCTDTQLTTEQVEDIVGAMVDDPTETCIAVTYDDTNGNLEFVVTVDSTCIANNVITPDDVLSTGQTDEYCLTYEVTGDTWAWQACGGAEVNDLTAAVTWANVPDANVTGSAERDEVCNTTSLSSSCEINTAVVGRTQIDETLLSVQTHATDCTTLTCDAGSDGEPCFEQDADTYYVCDGSGTPGWKGIGGGAETNDLEATDPPTIADTEIYVGNGAGSGTFVVVSGDASLANTGALTVSDLTCTDCIGDTEVTTNAGTSLAADLEEETHASEHSTGGGDTITVTNLASACTDAQVLGGNSGGTGVECQADANTQLSQEQVEDYAGGLIADGTGTHTGIAVTYQGGTNDVDFVVDHDAATNFVTNEHIDWTGASAGTIHATNYVDNDTTCNGVACSLSDDTITLIQSATPTPTVEGRIEWDTDDDRIAVGDGVGTKVFHSGAHTVDTTCLDGGVTCNFAASATEGGNATNADALEGVVLGTLTDGQYCTYTSAGAVINCNSSPGGSGDITDVFDCATGDCADIAVGATDSLDFSAIDANAAGEGLVLPQTTACGGTGVATGAICYGTTSDQLCVWDGAAYDCQTLGVVDSVLTQEQVEDYAGALIANGTGTHTGITVTYQDGTDDVDLVVDHDAATNFVANEHIDWTGASAGTIHATNYVDNDTTCNGVACSLSDDTITLIQSATPTPTVEGRIEWDTDTHLIAVGDSAGTQLFYPGAHTTDTNANTICTGTTTYLDGEGNCDDISAVYQAASTVLSDLTSDGTDFGTLTDGQYCTYSSAGTEIVCNSTPGGSGDITDVFDCASGDCADIVVGATDSLDFSAIDANAAGEGLVLPQTTACGGTGIATGAICYGTTGDDLCVWDGAAWDCQTLGVTDTTCLDGGVNCLFAASATEGGDATNALALEGTDFGTLTDGRGCTYDSTGTEVDCDTVFLTAESDPAACTNTACTVGSDDTLTLVQSATPAPTVEGRVEWDTDDDRIVVGDSAGSKVFYSGAHTTDTTCDGVTCALTDDTANTEAADNSTTQLATTAFVQQELNGAGGTNLTCSGGACNVDDAFLLLAGDTSSGNYTLTGDWDFGGGGVEVENGITPPACTTGQLYVDTDATSGQQLMACEAGTFVKQGDGGGAETNDLEAQDPPTIADTEIYVGDGAGSGTFVVVSGDASLANTGALTVSDLTCTDCINATEIEDLYLLIAGDTSSGNYTLTGDWDFGGGGVEIENGTTPPACTEGQLYFDTDATSGQRLMGCEAGTFVKQGDGGGTEVNDLTAAVTWANVPDANVAGVNERDEVCGTTSLSSTCEINTASVTSAQLRNSAAVSVIGRSANSSGAPADIVAGTDGQFLRRSSSALGFGAIVSGDLPTALRTRTAVFNVEALVATTDDNKFQIQIPVASTITRVTCSTSANTATAKMYLRSNPASGTTEILGTTGGCTSNGIACSTTEAVCTGFTTSAVPARNYISLRASASTLTTGDVIRVNVEYTVD